MNMDIKCGRVTQFKDVAIAPQATIIKTGIRRLNPVDNLLYIRVNVDASRNAESATTPARPAYK
jgi:5,10-methylene-tetrahydrofolate dehydrogenase/methenyl tetrahydrofolate cyclohydrolase